MNELEIRTLRHLAQVMAEAGAAMLAILDPLPTPADENLSARRDLEPSAPAEMPAKPITYLGADE